MNVLSDEEISALLDDYDEKYEGFDREVEQELTELLSNQDYLTKAQLKDVIRWKMGGQGGRATHNIEKLEDIHDGVIENVTRAAFLAEEVKTQLKILSSLPGIGYATATVILTFNDPEDYAVGDRYINKVILGEKTAVSPANYTELLSKLREYYPDHSLRTIERAHYMKYFEES